MTFRMGLVSIAAAAGMIMTAGAGFSPAASRPANDLNTLQASIALLNQDPGSPAANNIIKNQLSEKYNVTLGQVDSWLGANMRYGDLAAALAVAEKMPGGKSDANINKIASLRGSGTGWDRIAEELHVKLSHVAASVSSLEDKTHARIKEALGTPIPGAAAGGTGTNSRQNNETPDVGM